MKVSICRPAELSITDVERWRSFQQSSHDLNSPFFSPEFAMVIGRHHPGIEIAVIEDGGMVQAYFPYERCAFGIGKALGYGLTDNQGVIHSPGLEWSGIELLEACKLVTWEFDSLIIAQAARFAPQELSTRISPSVDLSEGWDSWIARKKSVPRFRQIRQRERKLQREIGPAEYQLDSRCHADLELLMRWKSDQYRRTGRSDRFARKWFAGAVRELFDTRTDSFSVKLSTMRVAGRPVSLDLSLCANGAMAGWFPAFNRDYARYGVGLLHLQALLKMGAESGIRSYNLGAGEEEYKEAFANTSLIVAAGALSRRNGIAAARWLQMAPKRMAVRFVLDRPSLRKVARNTLNQIGRVRSRISW